MQPTSTCKVRHNDCSFCQLLLQRVSWKKGTKTRRAEGRNAPNAKVKARQSKSQALPSPLQRSTAACQVNASSFLFDSHLSNVTWLHCLCSRTCHDTACSCVLCLTNQHWLSRSTLRLSETITFCHSFNFWCLHVKLPNEIRHDFHVKFVRTTLTLSTLSLSLLHTLSYSLSLSLTHSLLHTHTHSLSLSYSLSPTLTLTLSHSHTVSLSHSHSHSLSLSLSRSFSYSHSLSLTHPLSLSLSLTLSHSLSHTLSISLTVSLTRALMTMVRVRRVSNCHTTRTLASALSLTPLPLPLPSLTFFSLTVLLSYCLTLLLSYSLTFSLSLSLS